MSDKYTFRILGINEYELWDLLVDKSIQGTIFHKNEWLGASGWDYRIFGCFNNGNELIAGFTCGTQKIHGKWTYFGHPRLTPYQGNVYTNIEGKYVTKLSRNKCICHEIAKFIKTQCTAANITLSPYDVEDVMPFIWERFKASVRYTYVINLQDTEKIWKDMDLDCRNSIRKAIKDGVIIDIESDFMETIKLQEKTLQRQNKSIDPSFVESAIRYNQAMELQSKCKNFVAKNKNGNSIATVYVVWDTKRSYYLMGGYDHENAHSGASSLAIWTAIQYLRDTIGLSEFDFEGTTLLHTEPFFRSFGGKLTPYYTVSWVHPKFRPFLTAKRFLREVNRMFRPNLLDGSYQD